MLHVGYKDQSVVVAQGHMRYLYREPYKT